MDKSGRCTIILSSLEKKGVDTMLTDAGRVERKRKGNFEISDARLFSGDEVWMMSNTKVAHTCFMVWWWQKSRGVSWHQRARGGDNAGLRETRIAGHGRKELVHLDRCKYGR
jgi:hypothetical protein